MSDAPADLKYTASHEWVRTLPDGEVEVGITQHAQQALGDLVFVELPDEGRVVAAGEACVVVESVKAASDVYSPVAGEVVATNIALTADPGLVNQDPYGGGWLFRLRPSAGAGAGLMDAEAYLARVAAESH